MRVVKSVLIVWLLLDFAGTSGAQEAKPVPGPVFATVQTSLHTADNHIRQFAFDGDDASYFASKESPGSTDHFTLVFDKPVALESIKVTTGLADGANGLDAGNLEGSANGKSFQPLAQFSKGTAAAKPEGKRLLAVRIKPSATLTHPLAIREFTIQSDPPIASFKYPVEFVVETDAPEMKDWVEKVALICERQYFMINEEELLQPKGSSRALLSI